MAKTKYFYSFWYCEIIKKENGKIDMQVNQEKKEFINSDLRQGRKDAIEHYIKRENFLHYRRKREYNAENKNQILGYQINVSLMESQPENEPDEYIILGASDEIEENLEMETNVFKELHLIG